MALSNPAISCFYAGGDGADRSKQPLRKKALWSEEPATGVATTNSAPSGINLSPVFSVYWTADIWVAMHPTNPNPNASPRTFVSASGGLMDIYCDPGDKLAWVAA